MGHATGNLQGEDGTELYYQNWYPDSAPRASIAVLHGAGGHSGQSTYAHLINHLVPLGYSIYGLDLRGHGRSEGQRGSINRWDDYRSDLRMFLQLIHKSKSDQPIFLLGQSLGGLIALEYTLHSPQEVPGVIVSAPALSLARISSVQIFLLKVLSLIRPHQLLSPSFEASGLSRDPEENRKVFDDPLADPKLSPRLLVEILAALHWTQAHAADFRAPLLLIHGDADPITPPEGSQTFFRNVNFEDKTLKLYEDGLHQAFIDINRQQVFADIEHWLDQHA